MTNVALIARKLATLDDHLGRLKQRRPATIEIFAGDLLLQDAIATFLGALPKGDVPA